MKIDYVVKPAHTVTSIKQSPVLKGHFFPDRQLSGLLQSDQVCANHEMLWNKIFKPPVFLQLAASK
jgi:hypothetical protein